MLIQDLWFYLARVVAGQESTERICATRSVTAVEALFQLSLDYID
jgi:hypothetical protein